MIGANHGESADRGALREKPGRVVHGLSQTLSVWLTVSLLIWLLPHVAVPWAGIGLGVLSCILLGQWHRRRGRVDAAVGAFTGVVLWPVIIGVAIIVIGIVSDYRSAYE